MLTVLFLGPISLLAGAKYFRVISETGGPTLGPDEVVILPEEYLITEYSSYTEALNAGNPPGSVDAWVVTLDNVNGNDVTPIPEGP